MYVRAWNNPHGDELLTKEESYVLYHAGLLGNKLKTWSKFKDFRADFMSGKWPYDKHVALRLRGVNGSQIEDYCVAKLPELAIHQAMSWNAIFGIQMDQIEVNEAALNLEIVLQGEVMRSHNYMDLRYSTSQEFMRPALKNSQVHASGLQAKMLVQYAMDGDSWDNLNHLWDVYPGCIVEFTSYTSCVGELGWNTIFWEARGY